MRVFIATSTKYASHEPVLEYSIRKHASGPVDIIWMRAGENDLVAHGCTGFTNFRYAIPRLAGRKGYGIYLDVDMLVLADLAGLWAYRQAGKWVCMKDGSTEVSVIDCTLEFPDAVHLFGKGTLSDMAPLSRSIPLDWNVKDKVLPSMKLLHFTDLYRQPWFTPDRDDEATRVLKQYEKSCTA